MLLGVDMIEARMTLSDEYGVYRQYRVQADNIQSFLLISCTIKSEALTFGSGIAGVLGVPFRNAIPIATPETRTPVKDGLGAAATAGSASTGPKQKIMGIGAQIRSFLAQGLMDSDIVEKLVPMYVSAGKTETVARNLLKPYVAEIRKLEAKKRLA
jgi:hypothetical protein